MTDPQDTPKTSKDLLYAKRLPEASRRHIQVLRLDAITTKALTEAQHLDSLTVNGKLLSRTVFIRRAVLAYSRQLLHAAKSGNRIMLETEMEIMLSMASPVKRKPLSVDLTK